MHIYFDVNQWSCDFLFVCVIKGPSHVGNSILAREGMLDMIIAMADSGSAVHVVSSAVYYLNLFIYLLFIYLLCK